MYMFSQPPAWITNVYIFLYIDLLCLNITLSNHLIYFKHAYFPKFFNYFLKRFSLFYPNFGLNYFTGLSFFSSLYFLHQCLWRIYSNKKNA